MKSRMIYGIAAVAFMAVAGTAQAKTDSGQRIPNAVTNVQPKVEGAECTNRSVGSWVEKRQILPGGKTAELTIGTGKK